MPEFLVKFTVRQPDTVSNHDLFEIWKREATAAMGAVVFAAKQRGRAVRGSVEVGQAGSAVAVRLKRGAKTLGKLLQTDVAAGKLALKVALNHSGKKLLKAKKKLTLTVEVAVDPPAGVSATAKKAVTLRK